MFWFFLTILALKFVLNRKPFIFLYMSLHPYFSKEISYFLSLPLICLSGLTILSFFFLCLHRFSAYFKAHQDISASSKVGLTEPFAIQPFTALLPNHPHIYILHTHKSPDEFSVLFLFCVPLWSYLQSWSVHLSQCIIYFCFYHFFFV